MDESRILEAKIYIFRLLCDVQCRVQFVVKRCYRSYLFLIELARDSRKQEKDHIQRNQRSATIPRTHKVWVDQISIIIVGFTKVIDLKVGHHNIFIKQIPIMYSKSNR